MNKYLIIIPLILFQWTLNAQDPKRFEEEIKHFREIEKEFETVFTGSSSVRLWQTLSEDFPEEDIINTGFGGSHMSDLTHHMNDLILRFNPKKIFVYEGDNDIHAGKSTDQVMRGVNYLHSELSEKLPGCQIYFISAKPSPSRFNLKEKYERYNQLLKEFCATKENAEFIDVWSPMLNSEGQPIPDIFIGDKLHMNAEGYDIWEMVIGPFLD